MLGAIRAAALQPRHQAGPREKLAAAISEGRSVLQYDPNHEGAKRNIETAERLLKGLQERQQKQRR